MSGKEQSRHLVVIHKGRELPKVVYARSRYHDNPLNYRRDCFSWYGKHVSALTNDELKSASSNLLIVPMYHGVNTSDTNVDNLRKIINTEVSRRNRQVRG